MISPYYGITGDCCRTRLRYQVRLTDCSKTHVQSNVPRGTCKYRGVGVVKFSDFTFTVSDLSKNHSYSALCKSSSLASECACILIPNFDDTEYPVK